MAELPKYFYFRVKSDGLNIQIEDAFDADVVEVVRCKDCVFFKRDDDTWAQVCTKAYAWDDENWFCADGRRE